MSVIRVPPLQCERCQEALTREDHCHGEIVKCICACKANDPLKRFCAKNDCGNLITPYEELLYCEDCISHSLGRMDPVVLNWLECQMSRLRELILEESSGTIRS